MVDTKAHGVLQNLFKFEFKLLVPVLWTFGLSFTTVLVAGAGGVSLIVVRRRTNPRQERLLTAVLFSPGPPSALVLALPVFGALLLARLVRPNIANFFPNSKEVVNGGAENKQTQAEHAKHANASLFSRRNPTRRSILILIQREQ